MDAQPLAELPMTPTFRNCAAVVLLLATLLARADEAPARHVILLVLDGERYSETWDSPRRVNIPRCAGELTPQGTLLTHCVNDGSTFTLPGHCSLLTGFNDELQGSGTEFPAHPSILQLMVAKGLPVDQAWLVASKDKLHVLSNCSDPKWKDKYIPRYDCGLEGQPGKNREDKDTMARVREVLQKHRPRFMAINLKEPDSAAHQRDWNGYIKGIQECDALAADFWIWLQTQPAFKENTTLIIANDHGRHIEGRMEGFSSHGDGCSGCRHIGCLVLGPDVPRGVILSERCSLRDIAATMAAMLDVNLTGTEGRALPGLVKPASK